MNMSQKPILESLQDCILIMGADGLIEYANPATTKIIGRPPQEILGQPVTDVVTNMPMLAPDDAMPGGSRFEMNGRIIEGRMHAIDDTDGDVNGMVVTLRDVTTQFQAEQARDKFLTTVSQELRTPLTVINGYVELLHDRASEGVDAQQPQFFNTIQRSVNRMIDLTDSLIFVSTIKGGRLQYGSGLTDLRLLANQIAREQQEVALAYGQEISVDVDARLPLIQTDPIHMATILEELLGNAIKYNRRGGTVRLDAMLAAESDHKQEFAVVSISDDGIGIDPAARSRIFEDFYQPQQTDAEEPGEGIGMGLPIVRALVEAYNGRIWFESTLGAGSTFIFIVPVRQPEFAQLRPHEPEKRR